MNQLTPASPHVIVMVGIPGAGKSAFAERFAETFSTPIINQTRLAREHSLDDAQSKAMASELFAQLVKTRQTILYDGDLPTKAARLKLIEEIIAKGYRPLVVWVQTESLEAKRRATKPHPKGSGYTEASFDQAIAAFQPPEASEQAVVISGKHTYASQLKVVLRQLSSERPELRVPARQNQPKPSRRMIIQ